MGCISWARFLFAPDPPLLLLLLLRPLLLLLQGCRVVAVAPFGITTNGAREEPKVGPRAQCLKNALPAVRSLRRISHPASAPGALFSR